MRIRMLFLLVCCSLVCGCGGGSQAPGGVAVAGPEIAGTGELAVRVNFNQLGRAGIEQQILMAALPTRVEVTVRYPDSGYNAAPTAIVNLSPGTTSHTVRIGGLPRGLYDVVVDAYDPEGHKVSARMVAGVDVPTGRSTTVSIDLSDSSDLPPTVNLTNPGDGQTVSGSVNLVASASDDNGVTQVEFLIDGVSLGFDTTAPFSRAWNTASVADGAHTVRAVATDTIGQNDLHQVVVTVANVAAQPPTVAISSPLNLATVSATVNLQATANDDVSVAQVEFFVDGNSIGVDNTAPYQQNWDTTAVVDGSHTIRATATDNLGLTADHQIAVTVTNTTPQPPTVNLTNPLDMATVSATVNLQATANDDVGITQVEFFIDGGSIGVDNTAPFEQNWDTTAETNGSHLVRAVATDTDMLTSFHEITVTVNNLAPPIFSIEWASVSSAGVGGAGASQSTPPAIDADGSVVVFDSLASNLVAGDTNGLRDTFVREKDAGQTTRVSVDSMGYEQLNNLGSRFDAGVSDDGQIVTFSSSSNNLVPVDAGGDNDIFVHDRASGLTTMVSVDSMGNQANWYSRYPSISGDGQRVCFESIADNLAPGDVFGTLDAFVHDRGTGQTIRASEDAMGNPGNGQSITPYISNNGQFVTFASSSSDLVAGDANGVNDIFLKDLQTGAVTLISVDSMGAQANASSINPTVSADGRYVAFESLATNLVASDTNGKLDVFVHDTATGQTIRASVDAMGVQSDGDSRAGNFSADGRFLVLESTASNLVSGDTNGFWDIFVKDLQTGQVERVSLTTAAAEANNGSGQPAISDDGRWVVFVSLASNLVPGGNGNLDIYVARNVMQP